MLSVSVGPFVLALNHVLLLVALALATLVGWLSGRRRKVNPERALFGLFLLGLLFARLAFVLAYWTQYQPAPLSIADIRDGGFLIWPGVIAILIGAVTYGWNHPAQRMPMGLAVASGLVFWGLSNIGLNARQDATQLPDLILRNASGEAVHLRDYRGKPLVINLWAAWCPPCRREMPVLAAAQQGHPDVTFLFVNQAESPREVATFLAGQGLHLDNVLFDSSATLAQQVGSSGLPTTLFYASNARLTGSHVGELSDASLKHALSTFSATEAPLPSRSTQ